MCSEIFQVLLVEGFLSGLPSNKIINGCCRSMPHFPTAELFALLGSCRVPNSTIKVIIGKNIRATNMMQPGSEVSSLTRIRCCSGHPLGMVESEGNKCVVCSSPWNIEGFWSVPVPFSL